MNEEETCNKWIELEEPDSTRSCVSLPFWSWSGTTETEGKTKRAIWLYNPKIIGIIVTTAGFKWTLFIPVVQGSLLMNKYVHVLAECAQENFQQRKGRRAREAYELPSIFPIGHL